MIEIVDVSRTEATAIAVTEFGQSEALANHLRDTERFLLIFCNGAFLGLAGAGRPTLLSVRAYIWFAETPAIRKYPVQFIRGIGRARDIFLAEYESLVGICYHTRSRAWLEFHGAEFGTGSVHGGTPFIFRRRVYG